MEFNLIYPQIIPMLADELGVTIDEVREGLTDNFPDGLFGFLNAMHAITDAYIREGRPGPVIDYLYRRILNMLHGISIKKHIKSLRGRGRNFNRQDERESEEYEGGSRKKSPWISFVKQVQNKYGCSYKEALTIASKLRKK